MAQTIIIAREYRKRPSEILGITNAYAAYCFDEVAVYLTREATEQDGTLNWEKLRWPAKKDKSNNNEAFKEFITKGR